VARSRFRYNDTTPRDSTHDNVNVGTDDDDDEYTPIDSLERALEDALAEAEIKARSADEKARAMEHMAAKMKAGPPPPAKPSINLMLDGEDDDGGYLAVNGTDETSPDTEW
jgi:hypothetical protein